MHKRMCDDCRSTDDVRETYEQCTGAIILLCKRCYEWTRLGR